MMDGNRTDYFLTGRLQVEIMLDGYTELMVKSILTDEQVHGNKYTTLQK
jgi:hypothetical protein